MSEIHETRRANLKLIIGSEKIATFARNSGLTQSQSVYIQQIFRQKEPRGMGGDFARTLETVLKLDPGSLDNINPNAELLKNSFARKVAIEAEAREVPKHMQQTILYMLRTAPDKSKANE